jgi:hypothetical protein
MSTNNLNIELESWMYAAIAAKAADLGCSETELVTQGIKLVLGLDESSLVQIVDRLLEAKWSQLEAQTRDRYSSKPSEPLPKQIKQIAPTIRQIQVGDLVQIRDQNSPHYLEILTVTKVGMLMAHVATTDGEQNFLKRDLRFVKSE